MEQNGFIPHVYQMASLHGDFSSNLLKAVVRVVLWPNLLDVALIWPESEDCLVFDFAS